MKKSIVSLIVLGVISQLLLSSCEKENRTDFHKFELEVSQIGRSIQLNWNRVNHSKFEKYVLLRSFSPFPEEIDTSFTNVEVIKEIRDYEQISFRDESVSVWEEELYYKAFVIFNNRWLETTTVKTDVNRTFLPFNIKSIDHDKSEGIISFFDYSTEIVTLSDTDFSILKTFDTISGGGYLDFGKSNGDLKLYFTKRSNRVDVYDPWLLEWESSFFIQEGDIDGMVKNNQEKFFAKLRSSSGGGIVMYDLESENKVGEYELNDNYWSKIQLVNEESNTIVVAKNGECRLLEFGDNGDLLSEKSASVEGGTTYQPVISSNQEFIAAFLTGEILDNSLNSVAVLGSETGAENTFIRFTDFAFSEDNEYLYGAVSTTWIREIRVYSLPDFNLEKVYPIPFYINKIFPINDGIILIGSLYSADQNAPKYIIERLIF